MNPLKTTREQFEAQREIARLPECPELTADLIETITDTLFIPSNPQMADILFVFGSSYGDKWNEVAQLYHQGLVPVVYIAGGLGNKSFEKGKILSHMIRDDFVRFGVPIESIVIDERSTNTLEDAVFGKELFHQRRLPHAKILFACKAPHSGRCLRTLKKVFPDSELLPFTYGFDYENHTITAENWHADERGRKMMWGEYQRIKLYSSRGDICE